MKDVAQILSWIENSDISKDQQKEILAFVKEISDSNDVLEFQVKRLKDNLKINTRFLNSAVEDLERTVELLKDSNQQLNNFVKIASHDLKSPLRSISSFSALLDKMLKDKLTPKESEYFNIIENSAKSMGALIEDLLLFSRINAEDLNIKDESLNDMLNEVLQNLDFDIKRNEVVIENKVKPTSIKCDSIKFKQVLQNLIANGIKFSTFDGNRPHIVLDMEEDHQAWKFSIKDNGIGVEDKYVSEIFQEFKKLNGNNFEGTGMGLSICQKIVKKHDGKIWISKNNAEKGAEFCFTIAKNLDPQEDPSS